MFSVYSSTYVLVKMLHYKSYEIMNFDCWFKLNCKIFGSWLYFNACLFYYRWVYLLSIATHDLICYMYAKLLNINEYNSYAWWKFLDILEKQDEFLKSCWEEHVFGSIENFFLLKRGRSFLSDFSSTMCTFVRSVLFTTFVFIFPNTKTFLMGLPMCSSRGRL